MSQKEVEIMLREVFEEQNLIKDGQLNVMCFGLEERYFLNIESRKKWEEITVQIIKS